MASASDVKAGGAWVEITAKSDLLDKALTKADNAVKAFANKSQTMMTGFGKGLGTSMTKSFLAVSVAVEGAKKAFEIFGGAVARAMENLRSNGTDEQRLAIAKLDLAVESIIKSFNRFTDTAVVAASGPVSDAINGMQLAWEGCKSVLSNLAGVWDKTAGAFVSGGQKIAEWWDTLTKKFSAIEKLSTNVSRLWDKYINHPLEQSPILAKAAGDALHAAGERAMDGWDNDRKLLDELDQIDDKVNKSADDIKRANTIVAQLQSRWGDVGLSVDQVTGKVNGLGEAQKRVLELQNKARIAQLKLEKQNIETQRKAIENDNQQTMANAGPGAAKIFGKWALNKAGWVIGRDQKSMGEIAEETNQRQFDKARAKVDATKTQTDALDAKEAAIDAKIAALEGGQNWDEAAGRETKSETTPVGTNTKAGSMVDKYGGLSSSEAQIAKLNDDYAAMLRDRIAEFRQHGYSEEQATQMATDEFAADRKAVDEKIAKIREDAAKKEAEILEGGGSILKDAEDSGKSELELELESIEQRYIDARKSMIDQLIQLGKTEEEAAQLADENLKAERDATDKLKELAIQRDKQAQAEKEAEEMQKQAAEAKKAEIEEARAYVDEIEKGINASERSYGSSGGTFSAFDQLDTQNVAAETLNIEKQQLKEQKDMVARMRELIDLYESTDTTSAVFA